MPVRELRAAVREPGFARLYATRLAGQTADGVFQVGLAGFVLFSPEKQAGATQVAAALAILLVPFSLIGPFAGVLIDRWQRQRILVLTNLLRALAVLGVGALVNAGVTGPAFYISALVVLSLNRFVLATLSAGLPHVVRPRHLVTANAISTTSGTLAAVCGGAIGYLVRHLAGVDDDGSAAVVEAAAAMYLVATITAMTLAGGSLGPDRRRDARAHLGAALREVVVGFAAATRHLRRRPIALQALTVMVAQRLAYGFATVTAILLCRNYFNTPTAVDDGLRDLAAVVAASGAGVLLAALVTPSATARLGIRRWVTGCLVAAAVVEVAFGLPYALPALIVGGALLAVCAQGVRICVDTLVQRSVDDDFRGRVFALYDVLFNIAFVASAAVAALVLPANGRAPITLFAVAIVYLVTAAWWWRAARAHDVDALTPATAPTRAAASTSDAASPSPRPR